MMDAPTGNFRKEDISNPFEPGSPPSRHISEVLGVRALNDGPSYTIGA